MTYTEMNINLFQILFILLWHIRSLISSATTINYGIKGLAYITNRFTAQRLRWQLFSEPWHKYFVTFTMTVIQSKFAHTLIIIVYKILFAWDLTVMIIKLTMTCSIGLPIILKHYCTRGHLCLSVESNTASTGHVCLSLSSISILKVVFTSP